VFQSAGLGRRHPVADKIETLDVALTPDETKLLDLLKDWHRWAAQFACVVRKPHLPRSRVLCRLAIVLAQQACSGYPAHPGKSMGKNGRIEAGPTAR
jgi:hypothetical protein